MTNLTGRRQDRKTPRDRADIRGFDLWKTPLREDMTVVIRDLVTQFQKNVFWDFSGWHPFRQELWEPNGRHRAVWHSPGRPC